MKMIQQLEIAVREGLDLDEQPSAVLPNDRSHVWPAVYERRTFHKWSKEDEVALVGQIGFLPGNVVHISTRAEAVPCLNRKNDDNLHVPVVVQLYPMVMREKSSSDSSDGRRARSRKRKRPVEKSADEQVLEEKEIPIIEPFPTIYWLTHPTLRAAISKLELETLGTKLEQRLASEPRSMESMKRAHDSYGRERRRLLTASDLRLVTERNWESAFVVERGVAGIRNHGSIKCLHAHAAHFLSGGPGSGDNIVGQWVMDEVEKMILHEKRDEWKVFP